MSYVAFGGRMKNLPLRYSESTLVGTCPWVALVSAIEASVATLTLVFCVALARQGPKQLQVYLVAGALSAKGINSLCVTPTWPSGHLKGVSPAHSELSSVG
jgi:hypothetical protein